jgi:hypothetical protein
MNKTKVPFRPFLTEASGGFRGKRDLLVNQRITIFAPTEKDKCRKKF